MVKLEVERGISSIEMASLDGLLSELRNPVSLDNLRVWVSTSGMSRYTTVTLENGELRLRVHGDGETWVRGRFDELIARLGETQRRPAPSTDALFFSSVAVLFAVFMAAAAVWNDWWSVAACMLLLTTMGVPVVAFLWQRSKAVVVLQQQSARPPGAGAFNVTVGIVTIALAIAGLWVSWSAWQYPIK
ncbi:hypothetical protein [Streptomyces sp. NRRL F-2747]|uniref:hypothetical protein n=1 Tax=Streptomyces sp. NRRL F-2747 TaxID=1463843 RepID=UPI00131D28DA|nr:hypothetical protein [Streptomyces sp. NRRL F-2747]